MSKKVRIKFSADFGFSNKFYEKKTQKYPENLEINRKLSR